MDAKVYLQSYGWREGEALQNGGLKKPILVKHKKDTKGLGHQTQDASAWWEQLFDGTLKNMEVKKDSLGGILIDTNYESVDTHMRKQLSPLYRMFVKGEGLAGTVGKTSANTSKTQTFDAEGALKEADKLFHVETSDSKKSRSKDKSSKSKSQKLKSGAKVKKELKEKKAKKDKNDKKVKKDKKELKELKEKKLKKLKKLDSEETKYKDKKSITKDKSSKDKKSLHTSESKKRRSAETSTSAKKRRTH